MQQKLFKNKITFIGTERERSEAERQRNKQNKVV